MKNLINRLYFTFLVFRLSGKEVEQMAVVYATLIIKGYKTFAQVPDVIKPQVAEVLRELEADSLITE